MEKYETFNSLQQSGIAYGDEKDFLLKKGKNLNFLKHKKQGWYKTFLILWYRTVLFTTRLSNKARQIQGNYYVRIIIVHIITCFKGYHEWLTSITFQPF